MVLKRNDNKIRLLSILSMVLRSYTLYIEMMGYIAIGDLNIRTHRDITEEMWFGVG